MNKYQTENLPLDRMLRRRDVCICTGLSSTTLWRLERAKKFPSRIQLTESGAVGWSEQAVRKWLESRKPVDAAA